MAPFKSRNKKRSRNFRATSITRQKPQHNSSSIRPKSVATTGDWRGEPDVWYVEIQASVPLTPHPTIAPNPEPISSTSHSCLAGCPHHHHHHHHLSPLHLVTFQEVSPPKFCMHFFVPHVIYISGPSEPCRPPA